MSSKNLTLNLLVVSHLVLLIACETRQIFPTFEVHQIDHWGEGLGQTALVDMDQDGDLDWVAGNASHVKEEKSMIYWWEYRDKDHWVKHKMGKGNTDVGGAAFDVNGDGWIDFVSGSVLLLNTGNPLEEPFLTFDIETTKSHDTEFVDVDGDGKMDLLSNFDQSGLFWYEIPDDPKKTWKPHLIASAEDHEVHGGTSPNAVGDIDGDGDPDVVTARIWYENLGKGEKWLAHDNIDFGEKQKYGIAVRTWVGDLDEDGDVDLVQSENDHPDGRVAWFENDGKGEWARHLIRDKGFGQDWHSLAVADFDNDGDLDVYAGAGPLSGSKNFSGYIWENSGEANGWVEHEIFSGKQCHEVEVGDVDGDGDIDICTKPWKGSDEHIFIENKLIDKN